jgi:hypothetical protein
MQRKIFDMNFWVTFPRQKRLQYAEKAVARLLDDSVALPAAASLPTHRLEACQEPAADAFRAETPVEGLMGRFE